MTTYVEHAVTEVIPEPEPSEWGEPADRRWTEQEKINAATAHWERIRMRTHAEGLDD